MKSQGKMLEILILFVLFVKYKKKHYLCILKY